MSQSYWTPLKQPVDLRAELREEIDRLEQQLLHFDDIPLERRFGSRQIYQNLIRVRRELLSLLELDAAVNPEQRLLNSRSSEKI